MTVMPDATVQKSFREAMSRLGAAVNIITTTARRAAMD